MTAKSQHTIPRLHLQNFAGPHPTGQVWTYDAIAAREWSAIPEETCVQTHFYSAERDDGTMDTRLEEFLANVESHAASVYEHLLRGQLPEDPQRRLDFAQFLAVMHTRTTAMRRIAGEIRGRGVQIRNYAYASDPKAFGALVRRFEKQKGQKVDPTLKERVRQAMLDPSGYRMEVSKESTFMALTASDDLTKIFDRMRWSVCTAKHGYFITSDNPVVREVDPQTRHPIYGDHGFMNKTAIVTFPLSPKMLLVLSWQELAPNDGTLAADAVHCVNLSRAANSDRYLFAHIQDKRVARLAEKYKSSRPSVMTQGVGPERFASIKVVRRTPTKRQP